MGLRGIEPRPRGPEPRILPTILQPQELDIINLLLNFAR